MMDKKCVPLFCSRQIHTLRNLVCLCFWTSNPVLMHVRQVLYHWATSPAMVISVAVFIFIEFLDFSSRAVLHDLIWFSEQCWKESRADITTICQIRKMRKILIAAPQKQVLLGQKNKSHSLVLSHSYQLIVSWILCKTAIIFLCTCYIAPHSRHSANTRGP